MEWLNEFDSYIVQTINRKALSLIDNVSCLGTQEKLSDISNTEIFILPLKTTSSLQISDYEIIAALKNEYRRKKFNLATDNTKNNFKSIYDGYQVPAMKWMKQIWEELKKEIVFNC